MLLTASVVLPAIVPPFTVSGATREVSLPNTESMARVPPLPV